MIILDKLSNILCGIGATLAMIAAAIWILTVVAAYGVVVAIAVLVGYFVNATGFFTPLVM